LPKCHWPTYPFLRTPPLDADRLPHTESRYTEQQEREMGVRDSAGHTIQPTNAFMMIFLMYTGVAAVLLVIAIAVCKYVL